MPDAHTHTCNTHYDNIHHEHTHTHIAESKQRQQQQPAVKYSRNYHHVIQSCLRQQHARTHTLTHTHTTIRICTSNRIYIIQQHTDTNKKLHPCPKHTHTHTISPTHNCFPFVTRSTVPASRNYLGHTLDLHIARVTEEFGRCRRRRHLLLVHDNNGFGHGNCGNDASLDAIEFVCRCWLRLWQRERAANGVLCRRRAKLASESIRKTHTRTHTHQRRQ